MWRALLLETMLPVPAKERWIRLIVRVLGKLCSTVRKQNLPEPVDVIVCDASFISLAKVLEAPLKLARPGAKLIALIKPQFEAGRQEVGKGGVVRDPAVHERVCAEAKVWVESQGWTVLGITPSPITGPEGNVEFLLGAEKTGDSSGTWG